MRNRKLYSLLFASCMIVGALSGCSASSSTSSANTSGTSKSTEADNAEETTTEKIVSVDIDTSEASREETAKTSEPETLPPEDNTTEDESATEDISSEEYSSSEEASSEEDSSEGQTLIDINGYSQKQLADLFGVELENGQGIICWSAYDSAVVVTPLEGMEIFTMGDMTNNLYMCDNDIQISIYTIDDTYDLSYFNSLYDNGVMIDDNRLLVRKGDKEAEYYYEDDFVTISMTVTYSSEAAIAKYEDGGLESFMEKILDNCQIIPRK